MLDSLYGDLPPSKEESSTNSNNSNRSGVCTKSTSLLGSLYDDLDDTPGDDASPLPNTTSVAGANNTAAATSSGGANTLSSSSSATTAPGSASSAWAAHRLQLLTPAVVRKQTLAAAAAAAAAKTTTASSISSAPALASAPATTGGTGTPAGGGKDGGRGEGGVGGGGNTESSGGSSTGDDSSNDNILPNSSKRHEHTAAAATIVNSSSSSNNNKGSIGGVGGTVLSNSSNSKYPSIDVAAVAAAASAAAAAVAAQLKAVKTEAGLILNRGGVTGAGSPTSAGAAEATTLSREKEEGGGAGGGGDISGEGQVTEGEVKTDENLPVKTEQMTGVGVGVQQEEQQVKAPTSLAAGKTEEKEEKNGFVSVGHMQDEYDPTAPNDYISVYRERIRKQQREELERLRQQELEKQRRERELALGGAGLPPLSGVAFGEGAGAGVGPPGQPGGVPGAAAAAPAPPTLPSYIDPAKKSFAARMMEKMGWKHGEGLGVNKQGITAPLVAKKTAMRSGVIVQGAEVVAAAAQARAAQFNRPPTRVLLLLNMVGRGEVDEDLKQETEEEAAKFGNLLQVRLVEAPDAPDEEAVRIFCEYERKEEATLAFLTMNGRVFGGRTVKSKFYCEDRWQKEDLLPNPEEEADKKPE